MNLNNLIEKEFKKNTQTLASIFVMRAYETQIKEKIQAHRDQYSKTLPNTDLPISVTSIIPALETGKVGVSMSTVRHEGLLYSPVLVQEIYEQHPDEEFQILEEGIYIKSVKEILKVDLDDTEIIIRHNIKLLRPFTGQERNLLERLNYFSL